LNDNPGCPSLAGLTENGKIDAQREAIARLVAAVNTARPAVTWAAAFRSLLYYGVLIANFVCVRDISVTTKTSPNRQGLCSYPLALVQIILFVFYGDICFGTQLRKWRD